MKKLALMLILLGIAGRADAQAPPDPELRPGDVLRITVMRHPELTGEFPVQADGTLMHPVYRELRVTDIPFVETEAAIRALLARFESHPEFVLDPLLQVAIVGEVRQPSLYTLRPTTTIAQAVALAGGATERGRLDRVRLFRGGVEMRIDLSQADAGAARDVIRSGDRIVVERKSAILREYVGPIGSVMAALAAVLNLATR